MPVTRSFKQSFSGGEISPEMFGRIDDSKFQQGAAQMRNFIVKPQGHKKSKINVFYFFYCANNGYRNG